MSKKTSHYQPDVNDDPVVVDEPKPENNPEEPRGWKDRVSFDPSGGFAYRPGEVIVMGTQSMVEEALAFLEMRGIAADAELVGPTAWRLTGEDLDVLADVADLRTIGLRADPNYVMFTHGGCGCGFCGGAFGANPFNAAPFNAAPFNAAPFNAAPFNAAPFNAAPFNAAPFNAAPFNAAPFNAAPFNAAPFNAAPFNAAFSPSARATGIRSSSALPSKPPARRSFPKLPTDNNAANSKSIVIDTGITTPGDTPEFIQNAVSVDQRTTVEYEQHIRDQVSDAGLQAAGLTVAQLAQAALIRADLIASGQITAALTTVAEVELLNAEFVRAELITPDYDAADFEPTDNHLDPASGHGVFIAGLIAQLAPGRPVLSEKAISTLGDTSAVEVAKVLDRLVDDGDIDEYTILNLSFGGYADSNMPILAAAVRRVQRAGGVVVASAGNEGQCRPTFPAALPNVVGVGSIEPGGRAHYSNFGCWVRACAPGSSVVSSFFKNFDGANEVFAPPAPGDPDHYEEWANWTGTSFAAPIVVAALLRHMAVTDTDAKTAVAEVIDDPTLFRFPGLGTVVNLAFGKPDD